MLGEITETANNNGYVLRKNKKESILVKCNRISKEFPTVCNKCIKCLLMNTSTKTPIACCKDAACLVLGCSQKLVTELEKAAKKCHICLDVKENIQETTLDETWIDMEAEFPLISTPEALQELDWFMSENGYNEIATQIAQAMQDI